MKWKRVVSLVLVGLLLAVVAFADKPSGKIVVYSASGPEITEPLYKLFRSQYPNIEVTFVYGKTPELFARLRAEKNRPAADVMFGGAPITYDQERDLFEPYVHPERANFVISDPNNIWQPFSIFAQPLMYNTNLVKEEDQVDTIIKLIAKGEEWAKMGGIALADPSKSSTGWTIVSGITSAYSWNFIRELLKYAMVTPGSDAMFSAIKDGEAPVGWINEDLGIKWELAGLPVKIVYPKDVCTVQVDAYGLVKGAPHSELAKIFINFLGTKEAHELVSSIIKRRSVRKDVAPPGELPPLGELNLYTQSESREVVVSKFNKLLEELGK
ncbi:MAG: extracellular solute-binding protein [Thermotogae bacterium]|nr:extracellular solute-binding protein [Thermotogota bacterium]